MNEKIELLKHRIAQIKDTATERSYYPLLCRFFEEYVKNGTLKFRDPHATPEETSTQYEYKVGFPDITIRNGNDLIGWVEVKTSQENLNAEKFQEQFSKYKESLENIIFTNLREWQLWQWEEGDSKKTAETFFDLTAIDNAPSEEFDSFLMKFFESRAYQTRTPKQLALALAKKTRLLSKQVEEALEKSEIDSDLRKLKETFEKTLIQDISEHQFANMVAETMAYSLFLAALEHSRRGNGTELTLTNAIDYLPTNVPILGDLYSLIKKVSSTIPTIYEATRLLVDQLNASEIERIHQKLVEHKPGEDPVIQFYEPFLKEYDPKEREARGVYYTPKPVVDYIVRSVDWILRSKFGKEKGLADESVNLLDPATGTGTFLMSAIQEIYWNTKKANESLGDEIVSREFNKIVLNHILKHFYGFELLIAPYAVAHLKLTLEIERLGFDFKLTKGDGDTENNRFKVYLANTLDDPDKPSQNLFGFDSIPQESEKARKVKQKIPILAIVGNPPYSLVSNNLLPSMRGLVDKYKFIDGKKIKERGALQMEKILNDDYVKFISFAQEKIQQNGEGVVAYVNNHTFLDNPTMRAMRHHLLFDFDEIYILNLHGNYKQREKSSRDENVFKIQQGVSINLFIKKKHSAIKKAADVYYAEIKGSYFEKFDFLGSNYIETTKFQKLSPTDPYFFFIPRSEKMEREYDDYKIITTVLPLKSIGFFTSRDKLVIGFEKKDIEEGIEKFRSSRKSNEELCVELGIPVKKGWNTSKARSLLKNENSLQKFFVDFLHRPFDRKVVFYHRSLVWSMSQPVMKNILGKKNLALCTSRQLAALPWQHCLVSNSIVELCYITNKTKEGNHVFPLYIYDTGDEQGDLLQKNSARHANIDSNLANSLAEKIGLSYQPDGRGDLQKTLGPEDIFYYAYAIFHSPTYRLRYAEQLKIDFPRLPLTGDKELFAKLIALGNELVNLHLLGENPFDKSKTIFDDNSKWGIKPITKIKPNIDWKVNDICYDEEYKRVYVNNGQYFEGVDKKVWEFMIGSYQVCEKWLKDRKKAERSLSTDDLKNYMKIIVSIRETIRIMNEIDNIIPKWPID